MVELTNLASATPLEWDMAIASELRSVGIVPTKFRDYDTPNSWVKHTLKGKLGDWTFSREQASYSFWGDVPLATAEAIASEDACIEGCIPCQWFPGSSERPIARDVPSRVVWIDKDGYFRVRDEGQSNDVKEVLQHDADHKLRFVAEPSAEGNPFIQTYTFFSLDALKKFVEIAHQHRVDFKYTH